MDPVIVIRLSGPDDGKIYIDDVVGDVIGEGVTVSASASNGIAVRRAKAAALRKIADELDRIGTGDGPTTISFIDNRK